MNFLSPHYPKFRIIVKIFVFLSFLTFIVLFEYITLPSLISTEYQSVSRLQLLNHPENYEGLNITTSFTIQDLIPFNSSHFFAEGQDHFLLLCPDNSSLDIGHSIALRGISFLLSFGYILLVDYHSFRSTPYYYSIPGIILFLFLFFVTFRIDFSSLTIFPRRRS